MTGMNANKTSSEGHTELSEPTQPAKGSVGSKIRGALIVVALFPVLLVVLLNAQVDFDSFGTWINPVGLIVGAVAVAVIWAVTGKRQR
jgi:hypothetical protein